MSDEQWMQIIRDGADAEGYIALAYFGSQLGKVGIHIQELGFKRLADWIASLGDLVESKTVPDSSGSHSHIYIRLKGGRLPRVESSLQLVAADTASGSRSVSAGFRLTDWAYLKHLDTTKKRLADFALRENWSYQKDNSRFSILWSYLRYTFARLQQEAKICENRSMGVAAFHTGLVDNRYEPIYALFEANPDKTATQPWRLVDFCIAGEEAAGKRLVRSFNPLPQQAEYFKNKYDMLYDIDAAEPSIDYRHIILENMERLPLGFLVDNVIQNEELQRLLAYDEATIEQIGRKDYYDRMAQLLEGDLRSYRSVMGRFKEAVGLALKKVRWNYKTAIPMYYPTRNQMALLLPLALQADEQIDVAIVVERSEVGNYLGHTILTLEYAYNNARLVCRPESSWLDPDTIASSLAPGQSGSEDEQS